MPGPAKLSSAKPKNSKSAIKKFLISLKPFSALIIIGIVCAIASAILAVFGPKILGDMTTIATTSILQSGHIDWSSIISKALLLILIYSISAVLAYGEHFITAFATAKYTKSLRTQIIEKISRLPISYFDRHQFGDTLSRMSNDVDVLANSLSEELTEVISSITTIIGIVFMMFTISVPLSLIAIITVPISILSIGRIMKKAQKLFSAQRVTLGKLNSNIEENYSGQLIIKSNSHESESFEEFAKNNQLLYEQSWKSQFLSSLAFPFTHFFTNLGYIAICIFGGNLVITGKLLIGNLQSFIQYVGQFNRPITNISEIIANIQMTLAASERVFEFLEEQEQSTDPINAQEIKNIAGSVEFKNVHFAYKDKPIIKNFSIKIEPGTKVAIVGPTGAGKTTIINLLMRFYDPNSGTILIDDVPISELNRSDVRKLFGMVLQDTWLFSGSIEENLRYGNHSATMQDIRHAAKIANVDHYIESLSHGYKTIISEDSDNISAGEKQLLTIARAIISNPPMMILDEATSNVDTRTELLIQDALDKITKNRTSFIIAHRLSTIRNADIILVMKDGQIIEQGNHKTLIAQNGFYKELYNSQFSEN